MFYILVSRIPFIYNINDKKDKLFKTFLIGSICYIILHGFIYSRRFSGNNLIEKYRKYLMHLAGIDFVLTSGIVFLLDNKITKTEQNSYIENAEDNNEDNNEDNEENVSIENRGKMTREEILNNYYKNQMIAKQQAITAAMHQQQIQMNKNSPFINKADAEELKKRDKEEIGKPEEKKLSDKQKSKSSKSSSSVDIESKSKEDENKENVDELLDMITNTDLPLYKSADI